MSAADRSPPTILVQASLPARRWLAVDRPRAVLEARRVEEVAAVLGRAAAAADEGLWAAGLLSELTESTRANPVLRQGARWLTPSAACGLLPGTFRAELLARDLLTEARLRPEDLETADEGWLINSLRAWIRVELIGIRRYGSAAEKALASSGGLEIASSNNTDSGHSRLP